MKSRSKYSAYQILRKWTTPVHWALGIMCGVIIVRYGWPSGITLSSILMVLFLAFEILDDKNHGTHEGSMDWWESYFTLCATIAVAFILNLVGVIHLKW